MKKNFILSQRTGKLTLVALALCFFMSCEDAFDFELPEAGSQIDLILPTADFSYVPDPDDFTTIRFQNLSFESTNYEWNFGDGNTSFEVDPVFTFEAGEGVYPVTLIASDANEASDTITINVMVEDVFVAITPEIINGDFDGGREGWEFDSFSGGTATAFNTSSDGSPLNYDGSDSGSSKTAGAKWTMSTSAGAYLSSSTRYAYQPIVVSPNEDYILEFEYSIKTEAQQPGTAPGGNRIIAGIIDGHFTNGANAIPAFDADPVTIFAGTEVKGQGNFTLVEQQFTSNASGEIAILIYGVTDVDAYVDNVKVYPR